MFTPLLASLIQAYNQTAGESAQSLHSYLAAHRSPEDVPDGLPLKINQLSPVIGRGGRLGSVDPPVDSPPNLLMMSPRGITMSTVTDSSIRTLADLLDRLGRVPLDRIRFHPPPGTATEQDVLEIAAREGLLCELVDGVLVEKPMRYGESILAGVVIQMLRNFVAPRNLGHVTGEHGMLRLFPGLVRIPDVAFASWDRFPNRRWTGEPIPDLVPDLAIEVLSESNTPAEMSIKVGEYFSARVRLVWLVDPSSRTATVFVTAGNSVKQHAHDTLDGGAVLPGFTLSLSELFAELDRHG